MPDPITITIPPGTRVKLPGFAVELYHSGPEAIALTYASIVPELPAVPTECRICGADWLHGDALSPDQWEQHLEYEYQVARDYGATRDSADAHAERSNRDTFGTRPLGPSRPFGPWRDPAYVAAHLDHLWRNHP